MTSSTSFLHVGGFALLFSVGAMSCSSLLSYDDVTFGSTFGSDSGAAGSGGVGGSGGIGGEGGSTSPGGFAGGGPVDAGPDTNEAGSAGAGGSAGSGGVGGMSGSGGTGVGGASGIGGGGAGGSAGGTVDPYPCGTMPPLGEVSVGDNGKAPVDGVSVSVAGADSYRLIVPGTYQQLKPIPLLVIFSGTEGAETMVKNVSGSAATYLQIDKMIRVVIDGSISPDSALATAETAILDVRSSYQVDNDRTYLLSESAGTKVGLELGFAKCQGHFAAFWANDVNTSETAPSQNASALGFAPWGQVGPGGAYQVANDIISSMKNAGYRVPSPAPYSGPGAGSHGNETQFINACKWFDGKSRQP